MSVVPFRWHGSTRVEQLRVLLMARFDEWLDAWAVSSCRPQCSVSLLGADDVSGPLFEMRTGSGVLVVAMEPQSLAQIGCRLIGIDEPDTIGLAAGLGRRGFRDLLRKIMGSEANLVPIERAGAPVDTCNGVVNFVGTLGGVRIGLSLDASLCDALAPPRRSIHERLANRFEAVLPEAVMLEASLDLGFTELEQTVDLRPGDILKTHARLDSLIRLRVGGDERAVISGALVSLQGHRAFQCVNVKIQEP